MKHVITLHRQTIWNDDPYCNIKVYNNKDHLISMFQAVGPVFELYIDHSELTKDAKLCLKYLIANNIIEKRRSSLFIRTYKITQQTLLELL